MKQDLESDKDDAPGDFFLIQQNLISVIDEFRFVNSSGAKKMTLKAFAEYADISVPIITAITTGNRWAAKASRETIKKLAKALKVPVVQIYILSGFLTHEDFILCHEIEDTIELVYRQMAKDAMMTTKLPERSEWDKWPQSAKIALCMFYEDIVDKTFFRYSFIPSS